eukprot:EG_transcript_7036
MAPPGTAAGPDQPCPPPRVAWVAALAAAALALAGLLLTCPPAAALGGWTPRPAAARRPASRSWGSRPSSAAPTLRASGEAWPTALALRPRASGSPAEAARAAGGGGPAAVCGCVGLGAALTATLLGWLLRRRRSPPEQTPLWGMFAAQGAALPSWSVLAAAVPTAAVPSREVLGLALAQPPATGRLTLYRDRNGWCPYTERVWLAMLYKGLDFDEVLIDLQGTKPPWYKSEVRTGNTPAICFPDGRVRWESLDLLRVLEEYYPPPAYPPLFPADAAGREQAKQLMKAFPTTFPENTRPSSRAAFLFRGWKGDLVPRGEITTTLDRVERMLREAPDDGPFFLGPAFGAVDCCWAPFLERYAVQVPLVYPTLTVRPSTNRWPRLLRWLEAMEEQVPVYAARVQGDACTWTTALAAAVGDVEFYPALRAALDPKEPLASAADRLRDALTPQWEDYARDRPDVARTAPLEAASRVVRNREAIVEDICRRLAPVGVGRDVADRVLRCGAALPAAGSGGRWPGRRRPRAAVRRGAAHVLQHGGPLRPVPHGAHPERGPKPHRRRVYHSGSRRSAGGGTLPGPPPLRAARHGRPARRPAPGRPRRPARRRVTL